MNGTFARTTRNGTRAVRLVACALAAIVTLLIAAAGASAQAPDPILRGRWNQDQALTYSWRSGSVPPAKYRTAINAAAADANASRGSRAATFAYASGSSNLIGYGTAATCGPQGLACFSRNAPTSFTMWMREQGHVFDWGKLRWCQAYSTWPNGCFDVENVMLDEFGHVEILWHHSNYAGSPDYTDAVVQEASRAKPRAGWNAHVFARCDVAALQKQYDMRGWGAKYSTCLDLATSLSLEASADTVAIADSVTLTATLEVANDPAYGRLARNPISLRTVTLQQRPPGGAWSDVGTMSYGSTSGTYTRDVEIYDPTEFRALFARPSDEGLRASTSSTVTIAIPTG